ncbi:MAG: acyloxyacyl hydrolase [Gammaproteobacteria bacterium]
MKIRLSTVCILWTQLLFPVTNAIAAPDPSFEHPYGFGKMYGAFQTGYGHGFTIGNSGRADAKDVEYLPTFPSFGIGISDPLAVDSWYGGNFDFVTEGEFLAFLGPSAGHSAGLAIFARYNFLSFERFVPYGAIGVGIGYLDSNLERQSDGLIYYPQGVVGVNYFISNELAFTLSYRYHHMSNRGLKKPNTGINANVGLVGVEYHFN